jgi:3',5'-cyclic AMP phosphodiesterase CpdA
MIAAYADHPIRNSEAAAAEAEAAEILPPARWTVVPGDV